jgi:hypothetical protein
MAQDTYAVTHVMVDIETLGTSPGSAIVSIGAVAFEPSTGALGREFEAHIDLQSACSIGLKVEASTVLWWMGQSDAARHAAFDAIDSQPIADALVAFASWLDTVSPQRRLWAHGASFDPVLLTAAYQAVKLKEPWTFRDVRDTRTIFDLAGIQAVSDYRSSSDVPHTPLSDAKVQARAVCDAYQRLGLTVGMGAANG